MTDLEFDRIEVRWNTSSTYVEFYKGSVLVTKQRLTRSGETQTTVLVDGLEGHVVIK